MARPARAGLESHSRDLPVSNFDRFVSGVHALALSLVVVAVAGVVWIERDIHLALKKLPAAVDGISTAAGRANAAFLVFNDAEQKQADFYDPAKNGGATQQIQRILVDAKDLIGRTDKNLNWPGGALPALTTAIDTTNGAIADQNRELTAIERKAGAAIDGLSTAEAALDRALGVATAAGESLAQIAADPEIKDSLAKLDLAVEQANAALAQLTGIATKGNDMAAQLDAKLREALKPAGLAKSAFEHMLGIAGPAAQVATAVK